MKYGKIENGHLRLAPNPILHAGIWYGNPPAEVYQAEGYKPVRFTEPPETEPGYIAVPVWKETDAEIVQMWTEEPEPDEISEDRAYRIITGEEV